MPRGGEMELADGYVEENRETIEANIKLSFEGRSMDLIICMIKVAFLEGQSAGFQSVSDA